MSYSSILAVMLGEPIVCIKREKCGYLLSVKVICGYLLKLKFVFPKSKSILKTKEAYYF